MSDRLGPYSLTPGADTVRDKRAPYLPLFSTLCGDQANLSALSYLSHFSDNFCEKETDCK